MPSFDIVSEIDKQELVNALHQTNAELSTRFDFKGTDTRVEQSRHTLVIHAENEFQLKQAVDVLCNKMARRGIDLNCMQYTPPVETGMNRVRQTVELREGIDSDLARRIVKMLKNQKLKTQTFIQGTQLRVSGKNRDDLQTLMNVLRNADIGLPLQFTNFRN